jgi:YjjG family noncanonical pyrimidine nucleotidase
MKKYNLILFDIDGTLLDFRKAEKMSIQKTLIDFGLPSGDDIVESFVIINKRYWNMFERGEIDKVELTHRRHTSLFDMYGFKRDSVEFNKNFERNLGGEVYPIKDAHNVLAYLKSKETYRIFAVTNGFYDTQISRIRLSGLDEYIEDVFASDKVGFCKPQKIFFEEIFAYIGNKCRKDSTLIIGDSFTTDIRGGNNFGIDTCWVNLNGYVNSYTENVNYEIANLIELKSILY